MGFIESVQTCFRKYADFSGRASRSEFWYWQLFNFLFSFAAAIIGVLIFGVEDEVRIELFNNLISLALLIPNLAVTFRRLHDVNRSGAWFLIVFTIIGIIPLLIWNCTRGTDGANRYGEDPLEAEPSQEDWNRDWDE